MPSQLIRLFRTARYLRTRQAYEQVRRRVVAASGWSDRRGTGQTPDYPGCRWSCSTSALPPAVEGIRAEEIRPGLFRFLNVEHEIGFPPQWDYDGASRLWQYNLHYFDWLWVLGFDSGRHVVLDWIRGYPNGEGHAGWEPYPVSLRLVNWCQFFFRRFRAETEEDRLFCETLWESLWHQCQWLRMHLETHLLGNHYLENAAALVLMGACFHGEDAPRWLDQGMRILSVQIREQILPDGVHFELSPMYHCRVLYVLTLLMGSGVEEITDLLEEPVRRMSRALPKLCHPDGEIALLSDSARGIYHQPWHLLSYIAGEHPSCGAPAAEHGCFALPDAGCYGWHGADGTYVIADFGKIGPDHIPGHGHADIFSFELSLHGRRVITDSGVHDYESSDARRYCRSTAAHNTVEIEGQDQAELWGIFRMARRGYPRDVTWRAGKSGFVLSGWHDGYARLPGKPIHCRRMKWDANEGLTIRDRITSQRAVRCVSRLHLHPACQVSHLSGRIARITHPAGAFLVEADSDIRVEMTPYFERFYGIRTRSCLCICGAGGRVEMQYRVRIH